MPHAVAAALALAIAGPAVAAGERLTERCRTDWGTGEVIVEGLPAQARRDILALVANPELTPDTYHRLWRPKAASEGEYIRDWVILSYDSIQDTDQIARAIDSDQVLATLGVTVAWQNAYICVGYPPPVRMVITEYLNEILGHYFLSSTAGENAVIDSGGAGPGWRRTGESFETIESGVCSESRPVFRFYEPGARTHFFTVDTLECGGLRRFDPGWIYEGEAFGAMPLMNGFCPGKTTPIYRLYNNRWMFNDSNHRFVKRPELYEQMRASGWIGEGVAMCLDKTGSDWWQTN